MERRKFLTAAGIAIALPKLDCFGLTRSSQETLPKRMVCICAPLGLNPENFFPEDDGKDYQLSPYLEVVKEFRNDFTVVSGLAHAGISPGFGHQATASFLTGIPGAGRPGFRNSVSVDQFAAEKIGTQTRFPSLILSCSGLGISWSRTGAQIPAENSPSRLFAKMFLAGKESDVKKIIQNLKDNQSILDDVRDQLGSLQSKLGSNDREKLDEFLQSVRQLEKRLASDQQWSLKPKPKVQAEQPRDIPNKADHIGRARLMFDLTHLALQTDSTRIVTIMLTGSSNRPPIQGVNLGHHDLSHHGKDPSKLGQLKIVEMRLMNLVGELVSKLKNSQEQDSSLLDNTSLFLGSNLGNASSHSVKNLPVFLAGGGFKHGQHLRFDPDKSPPLCNLFVSMLQSLGIESDRFGPATGTLTGLA